MGRFLGIFCAIALCAGCTSAKNKPDGHHRSDVIDETLKQRPYDVHAQAHHDPAMMLAHDLTVIEDDLRRDGTITVKQPDVWGDGNLMYFLQEYDQLMAAGTRTFGPTIQAYIARSDNLEVQASTGLGAALGGPNGGGTAVANTTTVTTPTPKDQLIALESLDFELLKSALANAPLNEKYKGIGVEPTELARQHSTYIDVCQALRRRHMGDDNSRAAGYGLIKFRIPVSVLPGRETTQGHSAIVTLRAQLQIDDAHLHYTFPRLAVADLVDSLTPIVCEKWDGILAQEAAAHSATTVLPGKSGTFKPKNYASPSTIPAEVIAQVYRDDLIKKLVLKLQKDIHTDTKEDTPFQQEIRTALFKRFAQLQLVLERNRVYEERSDEIVNLSGEILRGDYSKIGFKYNDWRDKSLKAGMQEDFAEFGWFLAVHTGLLDHNLKRIAKSLNHEHKLSPELTALLEDPMLQFYNPESPLRAQTFAIWSTIIHEEFPIHVFTLDSQVEEQNVYDAFARRRELQLALAYNVAKGAINTQQKLAMSRELALEEATIGLNRTVVGFAHGNDTFGWYFHPRVQTPPTESTNIGALARTLWSTGPTEHYDLKHRNLEPGIRECEVLVAMPSFVNNVSFDVTTNWERIAHPGVTKRTYEEMLAQGGRVHQLKNSLGALCGSNCYRPGDIQRLVSRVDQLEQMLGMQTYTVRVPFDYEQSGNDLFDQGRNKLVPVATGFYGLDFLQGTEATDTADKVFANVFITGKNFHPTLTHVVVGGQESHSTLEEGVPAKVEVVNRQLLLVKIGPLNPALTNPQLGFQVRVGTPDGLSGPLRILGTPKEKEKAAEPTPKGFSFKPLSGPFDAHYGVCGSKYDFSVAIPEAKSTIHNDEEFPLPLNMVPGSKGNLRLVLTAQDKEGKDLVWQRSSDDAGVTENIELTYAGGRNWTVDNRRLETAIKSAIEKSFPTSSGAKYTLTATGYVGFDSFPWTKLLKPLTIDVQACVCPPTAAANTQEAVPAPLPNMPGKNSGMPIIGPGTPPAAPAETPQQAPTAPQQGRSAQPLIRLRADLPAANRDVVFSPIARP
ncbi:MAG: hypothetical protein QM811_10790 [Pirellulales bacterium]